MTDDFFESIFTNHPEVSKAEIMKRLEKEKKKTGGLISDEILLRMIGADLGVEEINDNRDFQPRLSINDIVPNLIDISLTGKIVAIYPLKTFNSKKSGKLASLLMSDGRDTMRVVFWNEQTEMIESGKISIGQVLRVSHAYTKEGRYSDVELHVGNRSRVDVLPAESIQEHYSVSQSEGKPRRIADLKEGMSNVTVEAEIITKPFARQVKTNRGEDVKVGSLELKDESGAIWLSAWRQQCEIVEKMKVGDKIIVTNVIVKKGFAEQLELSTRAETTIAIAD